MNALPCPSSIDARWAAGAVRRRRRGPHPESWAPSEHRVAFSRNFLWDLPTTHLQLLLFLLKWKGNCVYLEAFKGQLFNFPMQDLFGLFPMAVFGVGL